MNTPPHRAVRAYQTSPGHQTHAWQSRPVVSGSHRNTAQNGGSGLGTPCRRPCTLETHTAISQPYADSKKSPAKMMPTQPQFQTDALPQGHNIIFTDKPPDEGSTFAQSFAKTVNILIFAISSQNPKRSVQNFRFCSIILD